MDTHLLPPPSLLLRPSAWEAREASTLQLGVVTGKGPSLRPLLGDQGFPMQTLPSYTHCAALTSVVLRLTKFTGHSPSECSSPVITWLIPSNLSSNIPSSERPSLTTQSSSWGQGLRCREMPWITVLVTALGNHTLSVPCSLAKSIQRAGRTQTEQNAHYKGSSDPLAAGGSHLSYYGSQT